MRQVHHKNAVCQYVPPRLVVDIKDPGRHVLELPSGNAAALSQPVKNSGCEDIPGREAQPVALAARERRQHPFPMAKTPPWRASAATGAGAGWR